MTNNTHHNESTMAGYVDNPPTATPDKPPVATILRDAAGYLRRHGWCQGGRFSCRSTNVHPPACANGAIDAVVTGGMAEPETPGQVWWSNSAIWWLATALWESGFTHHGIPSYANQASSWNIVAAWNDRYGRTVSDVIAALERAATYWELIHGGLRAACSMCAAGCPSNNYNGYADPGAFGHCGCQCHKGGAR